MAELKHKISRYTPFVVALIYAAITLYCVCFHEVWVDEAQVWMLCKYLNPIELFRHLTNEGHPFTFYLLVMPLSKTLNDIFYMHLLCWFSCVISVFLLWKYSPFSNFLKTVITLSAPFLYFFPVIARSYSIVPVLILILCVLYKKQQSHPFLYGIIILLLTNTHIIMGMFCFILSLYFVYDYAIWRNYPCFNFMRNH